MFPRDHQFEPPMAFALRNVAEKAQIQRSKGETKSTDIETKSYKMSKSEMEALGIEDDRETIESQSQVDIIDSVDLTNCQRLADVRVTEQHEAACNTFIQGIIRMFSLRITFLVDDKETNTINTIVEIRTSCCSWISSIKSAILSTSKSPMKEVPLSSKSVKVEELPKRDEFEFIRACF